MPSFLLCWLPRRCEEQPTCIKTTVTAPRLAVAKESSNQSVSRTKAKTENFQASKIMHFPHYLLTAVMTAGTIAYPSSPSSQSNGLPTINKPRQTANGTHTMGFIGCSMAENVAQGYVAVGGEHMWGPYGTGGMVVQSWTSSTSASWRLFDQQVTKYGKPAAVWVQICIFQNPGVKYDEVKQMIANARSHAAPDATIYVTGQPLYPDGGTCFLAGANGPKVTDDMAKQAAADTTLNVTYPGAFVLRQGEVQDGCHANAGGQRSLGNQAIQFWG
ncbi:hypothetical protein F5Y06DRAFT_267218 [Hypoxylon sp. FL0890]|nr:hypothetical protein F5Y06DRAFT_267218 [Hypoxylon sp. FL0890]